MPLDHRENLENVRLKGGLLPGEYFFFFPFSFFVCLFLTEGEITAREEEAEEEFLSIGEHFCKTRALFLGCHQHVLEGQFIRDSWLLGSPAKSLAGLGKLIGNEIVH